MSALTPGLSALLDTACDRFDDDKARREADDRYHGPAELDGQLALFDVSEDGTTLVSFDGQTL